MRKFILSFALLLLAGTAFAQAPERKVTACEVEVIIATFSSFSSLGLEGRYNFRSPWDVGFRVNNGRINADSGSYPTTYDIVSDYNFRQGKPISFFVGAGMGVTTREDYDSYTNSTNRHTAFHFMPRAGVEFFNRARLTAYYNTFSNKGQSYTNGLGFSAGFVFGGSKIENKDKNTYHFEFEPSVGIATQSFINFSLEARYNFLRPWDVGVNAAIDFCGFRITTVGDYLFLRKKNATLFCGLGAGYAITDILNIDEALDTYGDACCAESEGCFCLYPRVGVELLKRFRLTATVNTYNFKTAELLLSFGVAIGGGSK
ncbi:MAG: hypothetical protein IKM12_08005 [Alistipes sp.]|nr:hypothetical protein [Alistipes sp.]